jgi:hypothetical protein
LVGDPIRRPSVLTAEGKSRERSDILRRSRQRSGSADLLFVVFLSGGRLAGVGKPRHVRLRRMHLS